MTIGIIGAGNMGSALCQAFISKDVTRDQDITISDTSEEKLKKLEDFGVKTTQNNQEVLKNDFIIIAVKPQGFKELAKELAGKTPESAVVISIMAGVSIENIMKDLNHEKIVRCMPNTPALVNEGVLGWFANENIDQEEKNIVQLMLSSAGYAFEVKKEEQIDNVTAISGCGPGFFFYLFDQWVKAASKQDLPLDEIKTTLIKTMKGSLALLDSSQDSAYELAQKVASKGGATEQGLKVLEEAKLEKIFEEMLDAALKRTKELNKE